MIEYKVIIPVLFVSGFIIINILQCKIFREVWNKSLLI